ncbi:pleckstrin-2 [Latimeria chalumnae]|uniref:Pleckstrin 2 n=1 Tax=Latimeria chalumnae TaxID=7897 RepID=H3AS09_LATCH|nr:PREDICTED: pleckstrin-2 [Latimeria chalumnae]|eukprot:XP_005991529.1 PREDICTED: pleckstrin-2 [Latimeria chalumnae]
MQEGKGILKEGFLVKRGHVVHNWKTRWFVLFSDKLMYYKPVGGKRDSCTKGKILLDGCKITCPCLEYENRPLVIKLMTKSMQEHFFEASSREERDSWAEEIMKALNAIQPGQNLQFNTFKKSLKLKSNIILEQVVDRMHDSNNGIKLTYHMEQGNSYKNTFTGSTMVDWLVSSWFTTSRFEAVTLASLLIEENFVKPVGIKSIEAIQSSDLAEHFLDDSTALYSFAETSKSNSKPEIQLNTVELSGKIVKQGYLTKQGHKRKNWKVRRFVLRAEPAYLHYYDPTKEETDPTGGFPLRGCLISALEDNGVPSGVKGNVQGNLFKIITQSDTHYYIQANSKAERAEWIEAIKCLI